MAEDYSDAAQQTSSGHVENASTMTPRHKDNFTELRIEEGVVSRLEGHLTNLPKMGVVLQR